MSENPQGMVSFPKSAGDRAILPTAGKYGHGLDFDADVELAEFEFNPDPETSRNYPAFDKHKEGHYAYFRFVVIHDGKRVQVRHHEPIDEGTGSALEDILRAIMPDEVSEDADGQILFDPAQVAPRKITGIEVGDPQTSKGVTYTGRLVGVKVIG